MGYTNAVSLNRLIQEVNSGGYDAIIHVGGNIHCLTNVCNFLGNWHVPVCHARVCGKGQSYESINPSTVLTLHSHILEVFVPVLITLCMLCLKI